MKKLNPCCCLWENKGVAGPLCPLCRGYYPKIEPWDVFLYDGRIVTGHISRDGKLVDVRPVVGLVRDPRQAVVAGDGKEINIYLMPLERHEEFHWTHTAVAVCRHGEEGFIFTIKGEEVFVAAKVPFATTNDRAREILAREESQKEYRALWKAQREMESLVAEASSTARIQSLAVDLLARDGKKARRHASGQNIYTWPEVAERLFGHLKDKLNRGVAATVNSRRSGEILTDLRKAMARILQGRKQRPTVK